MKNPLIASGVPTCDAWFDLIEDSSRLTIATIRSGIPTEFWVQIAEGFFIHFRHVADLKNQRIFVATPQRPECGEGHSAPSPLLQLVGPFQRDSQRSV